MDDIAEVMGKAISSLPEKERKVIQMRYGLLGRVYTQRECAEELDIDKDDVMKIEENALRNLRSLDNFKGYVNDN